MVKKINSFLKHVVLSIIICYQKFISPWLGNNCRFTPSCSEYTRQAIEKYGIIKGSFKAIKRILKCHPFNDGGYDPLK